MLFSANQARAAVVLSVAAVAALTLRLASRGDSASGRFSPALADSVVLELVEAELERRSLPVDVNSADPAQLELLEGIGPALAGRIVAERERGGPFKDADDLVRRLSGIGPQTVARLSGRIAFAPASAGKLER